MGRIQDLLAVIRNYPDNLVVRALDEMLPRWIPVSERLPVDQPIAAAYVEARVVVWDGHSVFEACYTAFFDPRDSGWSAPGEGSIPPPICWQWLPEPPEVK